jgi:hypothetical protein
MPEPFVRAIGRELHDEVVGVDYPLPYKWGWDWRREDDDAYVWRWWDDEAVLWGVAESLEQAAEALERFRWFTPAQVLAADARYGVLG